MRLLPYCLAFSPAIYFTSQNPTNNGDPSSPSQPDQTPAVDPSQQWNLDDEAAAQQVAPAVQPYEPPSWDEQDSVSAQSGWGSETAASAQPDWEDNGVERWGEEGSQVGQKQDADTNWGSGVAQVWEAESEPPQWEELQSVRGTRFILVVLWSNVIELGWIRSRSCCSVGVAGFHCVHVKCPFLCTFLYIAGLFYSVELLRCN